MKTVEVSIETLQGSFKEAPPPRTSRTPRHIVSASKVSIKVVTQKITRSKGGTRRGKCRMQIEALCQELRAKLDLK